MPKAIRIHAYGGPDVMSYDDITIGNPGPGQVRLRQTAIGVNYIDIYQRTGAYQLPSLPHSIGMEGAGVVEALGEGVTTLKVGDRVAYAAMPPGAYAEVRLAPASHMVKLPESIDDRTAASIMLQGMTARYLLRQTHRVKKGDWVLVHAAAGGMGLFLCQWAAHLGARVIGTTSTPEKAALARKNGCEFPILYTSEDFATRVKEITQGRGVDVVYDGVGKDVFLKSIESLAIRGHEVLFGAASGAPDPFSPAILGAKSASVTRPTLFHYTAARRDLLANSRELFGVIASGAVRIQPPKAYALKDAAKAHEDLTGRRTTGSLILIP